MKLTALLRPAPLILALMAIFTILTFRHFGISNDEHVQHVYGQLLVKFYASGFDDHEAFSFKNLYLYGGLFDLIAAFLEKHIDLWVWDLRHLLSAGFGMLGLVAVYRMGEMLGGERMGWVAMLLLAITGAWSGAMFTHTKDIPFAACMAWALYYTMQLSRELPSVPTSLSIRLGLALGCAFGLRIGAVFGVLYLLIILCIASCLHARHPASVPGLIGRSMIGLIPAAIVCLILTAILWPWSVMGIDNWWKAIQAFSDFNFDMKTIVNGHFISIGEVPSSYLLQYLWLRLPELFMLGLVFATGISLIALARPADDLRDVWIKRLPAIALLLAIAIPVLYVLISRPVLYNGIRHFSFLLPPLAVAAGSGIVLMWTSLQTHPLWQKAYAGVCSLLALLCLTILISLHPYQYTYYNRMAGIEFSKATRHWESDYWSATLPEASRLLKAKFDHKAAKTSIPTVAVCAEELQAAAYLEPEFNVTQDWIAADFFIATTNMQCDQVLLGNTIATVERRGAVLAVIKDRRALTGESRKPRNIMNNSDQSFDR